MATAQLPNRDIVLIVDDTPTNLQMLSTALDQAGYTALVALDGFMALEQLKLITPGAILLDAVMPGIDGFDLCRRLQTDPRLKDIPVIFMTALDDTDHLIRGLEDGAVDYLIKPVRPAEVVARLGNHLRRSRAARQARMALETLSQATAAVDANGELVWMTDRARALLVAFFGAEAESALPASIDDWLTACWQDGSVETRQLAIDGETAILSVKVNLDLRSGGALLGFASEAKESPRDEVKQDLGLTTREAEILKWVGYGKTNRQIGQILDISPRTVNKHLDHVFTKLGVENRAAAAAIAIRGARSA